MNRFFLCLASTSLLLASGNSAMAQEHSLTPSLEKLPAGANAVLVADLANVRESGVATKNQWFDSHGGKVNSGIGFLPDNTEGVILASQMDLEAFQPTWTAGLLFLKKSPDLQSISQLTHGTMDTMAGTDIVETSTDLFVFKTDHGLATFSPANRQMLAPWFTSLQNKQSRSASEYIKSTLANRNTSAGLVMVCDLTNLVSPASVLARAKDAQPLKEKGIDPQKFSDVVASVQGVSLEVTFTTGINALAKVDFGNDASLLGPVAKDLMTEVMENQGLGISDLSAWQASVRGNQMACSGELSEAGLRRLISLFDAPDPAVTSAKSSTDAEPVSAGQVTKQYFDAVTSMVSELRKEIGVGGQSGYKYAKWFSSYADKIDNLDMRNVDQDMLDFGASVSQSFRQINLQMAGAHQSAEIKNTNLMTSGRGSPAYRYRRAGYGYRGFGGYGYAYPWRYYGGYGGLGGDMGARSEAANNLQVQADKEAIHKKARVEAASFGTQVFTDIADAEGQVRREMVQKYPDNFK